MIRSRRLALVAIVVAFGISSCGDPSTTPPLADQPKVIELANGQSTASGGAAPNAVGAASADSKMAVFAPTEFTYDGELPALDGPAGSWYFAPGQQPDLDRIAKLAASLGVEGDVRTLPDEQGGGWAVGPEDYSGAVLTVVADGTLNWWLSVAPNATVGVACAGTAVVPAGGTGVVGSSGAATDPATPIESVPADAAPAPGPEVIVPDCPTPQPPPGVPTKEEALAKARDLFTSWGYDINAYQFDEAYADEWSASVNASLLLDGMNSQLMLSVGFGEKGAITYASGSLAEPQRGADYPTIGVAAGLERLKTQQNQYVGLAADGVATKAATDVVASQPALGAPAIAPCDAAPAVACRMPIDTEPVTVALNSVKRALTMVWAADDTIWLLPAYLFGSVDGGEYNVMAVDDAYVKQPDPGVATTEQAVEPGAVAGSAVPPAPSVAQTCAPVTEITSPSASVEQVADSIVGYCLVAAQELAKTFGYEVQVVRQDGVDLTITADLNPKRITVAVDNGTVTSVVSIG